MRCGTISIAGRSRKRSASTAKKTDCLLRERDINAFRAQVENPLTTNYRGVDVYKVSYWSQGPVFLQNLNLLEGFDLQSAWGTTRRSTCTPWWRR